MEVTILVKGKDAIDALTSLNEDGVLNVSSHCYGKQDANLHVVYLRTSKNGEDDAGILSNAIKGLKENQCLIIEDQASTYYEKRLFGMLAEFERKLRAVLYLAVSAETGELENDETKGIAEMEFGPLFTRLFVDTSFGKRVKDELGKLGRLPEKAELTAIVQSVDEDSVWTRYFKNEDMPTIRKHHYEIKDYRNAVMHAHQMSKEEFNSAKNLLTKANNELDLYISEMLNGELLQYADITSSLQGILVPQMKSISESLRGLSEILKDYEFSKVTLPESVLDQVRQFQMSQVQLQDIIGSLQPVVDLSQTIKNIMADRQPAISGVSESMARLAANYSSLAQIDE